MDDFKESMKPFIKKEPTQTNSESENMTLLILGNTRKSSQESVNAGKIEILNQKNETWKLYHNIGNATTDFKAIYYKNNLLILGGYSGNGQVTDVKSMNLETLEITKLPSMNDTREYFSATVINDNIYVCGGWTNDTDISFDAVEVWNPMLSKWLSLPHMLKKRNGHAAAAYNGKLYVFGGYNSKDGYLSSVEYYDPQTYTWTYAKPLESNLLYSVAIVVGDKIYVIGGIDNKHEVSNMIKVYHPDSNKWLNSISMPYPIQKFAAVMYDHKIYISGGRTSYDGDGIKDVYMFDPLTGIWSSHSSHLYNRCYHSMVTVPSDLVKF